MDTPPIPIPPDQNSDPTGSFDASPKGGLQHYQDDIDSKDDRKHDLITEELTDDPSRSILGSRGALAEGLAEEDVNDDVRESIEDQDQGDPPRSE